MFNSVLPELAFCNYVCIIFTAILAYFLAKKYMFCGRLLPSKGKVVLITGCDTPKGFGTMAARRMHEMGYVVFAGCLDAKTASDSIYEDLKESSRFHTIQMDVINQQQVDKAAEDVEEWLQVNPNNYFHGLVNNAGIASSSPLEWQQMSTFMKVFDVNYFGAVRATKAFLPLLRQNPSKDGRIVILSSIAGLLTWPYSMAYSNSKAAALSLADCLRIELVPFGISVSAVCPDVYGTNIITETTRNAIQLEREAASATPEAFATRNQGDKMLPFLKGLFTGTALSLANNDTSPVINCIIHALANSKPKRRYCPMNIASRIGIFLHDYTPCLLDAILSKFIAFSLKH